MGTLPGELYIAAGAVMAALIAGAFSYFNLVTSKEAKVSEFRQKWIDALRLEIATYVSRIRAYTTFDCHVYFDVNKTWNNADILRELSRLEEDALAAYHSIHLRINKNETKEDAKAINNAFIEAIETAQKEYISDVTNDNLLYDYLDEVVEKAQPLLKREWDRVRDGEPSYRWAKRTAIIIPFLFLILMIWLPVLGFFGSDTFIRERKTPSVKSEPASGKVDLPMPSKASGPSSGRIQFPNRNKGQTKYGPSDLGKDGNVK